MFKKILFSIFVLAVSVVFIFYYFVAPYLVVRNVDPVKVLDKTKQRIKLVTGVEIINAINRYKKNNSNKYPWESTGLVATPPNQNNLTLGALNYDLITFLVNASEFKSDSVKIEDIKDLYLVLDTNNNPMVCTINSNTDETKKFVSDLGRMGVTYLNKNYVCFYQVY